MGGLLLCSLPKNPTPLSALQALGFFFSLYLSIRELRKGPGKFFMGVLESPGKVLDFFVSKRVGTLCCRLVLTVDACYNADCFQAGHPPGNLEKSVNLTLVREKSGKLGKFRKIVALLGCGVLLQLRQPQNKQKCVLSTVTCK